MQYPNSTPHWRRYLRFWQPNVQADIDDEIRFHFDARIEELVAQGVAADEAHRRTVEEFGDVNAVTRELRDIDDHLARRRGRADRLDGLRQDVTFAARSLRGSPGMVAAIVVTLALGLGVNTAVFSLLDSIFLRPPAGVVAPGRVRRLWTEINLGSGKQYWPGYAYPQYRAVTEALTGLAETAIFLQPAPTKLGVGGTTLPITMSRVSSGYFPLLGVRASMGRFFTADEDRLGAGARVAVVSHALSQRALGGDASALGRAIVLGGERYTVIGIAALDFRGVDLDATDVWVPVATFDGNGPNPWWLGTTINGFSILLRPKEHVGDEAIEARATAVLRRPGMSLLGDNLSVTTRLGSIVRARGPGRPAQVVEIATRLGGVAVIVLLIACANVVNLLLARAVRRRREIALRLALGISRARLVRLLMIESLILAVAAGAAAILAAYWGGGALRSILLPDVHWPQSPLDWRVLVAAVVATFAAGSIAGLIPALQSASMTLTDALKTGAREGYAHRSALRSLLVMAQAALSVVLLVGAALFVQSLKNVRSLDLGFETSRLLFARVDFESKDTGRDSLV
ncbi:MAG TPA: ABC transporter permease, partial [Gemmatimonadaceae bacterium]|nr:ABC transporter permease [Gemmatimonadaceae bacterium]